MSLLVSRYPILESNRTNLAMCNECMVIPTWEVRVQSMESPLKAYACGEHVDTVLYKTLTRKYSNEPIRE